MEDTNKTINLDKTYTGARRVKLMARHFLNFSLHENIIYYKDLNTIFLSVGKNGSSTINAMFLKKLGIHFDQNNYSTIHEAKSRFRISSKEYAEMDTSDIFVFSFSRNPLTRLISCYTNKILNEQGHQLIKKYPPGVFYNNMPFSDFVKRVSLIPDFWADKHFQSQYSYIFPKGVDKVDYIGKVENFSADIIPIVEKFDLKLVTPINKTSSKINLFDFYDKDLAKMVFRRYKKGFEKLGYVDEYKNFTGSFS